MSDRQVGHNASLSGLDKILFADHGITKRDVVNYYERIADVILPHIRHRPLMLQRFPNGIEEESSYQKNAPEQLPGWVGRVNVARPGGAETHIVCNDAATLVYLANLDCITPHIWLSRTPNLMNPDLMVFDLDPSNDFKIVRDMAVALRDILALLGLRSFPMTSGSRGIHVCVPLDRSADYDTVRSFARDVSAALVDAYSDDVTVALRKVDRHDRLFVDVARNAYAQTVAAPYALRPRPGAPIATPLEWSEVTASRLRPNRYTIKNIFRRIEQRGDPWKEIWKDPQSLQKARKTLDSWMIPVPGNSQAA